MLKNEKRKVGYADIVGDLLHWGHIEFLRRCRNTCDYLVVGVEPDETMRANKRETIFSYEKRVEMIKELRCVDEVRRNLSWDATGTMEQLVSEGYNLKFWFHGDDNEYPRATEFIESIGGEAIITPYIKGINTTQIIETILERYGVRNHCGGG